MQKILFIILFVSFSSFVKAQNTPEKEVISVIDRFFEGMKKNDTTLIRTTLAPSVRLQTTGFDKEKKAFLRTESINAFLASVAQRRDFLLDERLLSYEVRTDDNMATAWTPYEFYLGDKFSHCGVNAFQLFKSAEGWKIIQITDTRRKEPCKK